jgi:hypothetical protein
VENIENYVKSKENIWNINSEEEYNEENLFLMQNLFKQSSKLNKMVNRFNLFYVKIQYRNEKFKYI